MPRRLLLLLLLVTLVLELFVLVQVVGALGLGWTVLLMAASAIVGAILVRREGARAWRSLTAALAAGRLPTRELADGALVLVGGLLLLLPGFVTDLLGLLIVIPGTRSVARVALMAVAGRRVVTMAGNARRPGPGDSGPVVQGEVVDP